MKNVVKSLLFGLCIVITSCDVINNNVAFITYDDLTVSESGTNDGTFSSTITINVSGDTFKETLTEDDDYAVTGLNDDLTSTLTRVDEETLTLAITGTVADHVRCATETVGFNLYSSAMDSGSRPQNASVDLYVSFTGATYALSGTSLSESSPNSGAFTSTASLMLAGGGTVSASSPLVFETHYNTDEDPPDGLTLNVTVPDPSTINFDFVGSAASNESSESTAIIVSFLDDDLTQSPVNISPFSSGAFCNNGTVVVPLTLTFSDCAEVEISGSLSESDPGGSPGEVTGTATVTISNGSFEPGIVTGDFSVDGALAGLTLDPVFVSANTVTFTFSGAANTHNYDSTDSYDISVLSTGITAASEFCDAGGDSTVSITFDGT